MKKFILALLASITLTASAAECDHLYPNQKKILVKETVQLCNSWYVSVYDEKKRRVVFVSEVLDPKEAKPSRNSAFRADTRVKFAVRPAELDRSGFDRGHLVPADDASNQKEMNETFLMTNVVPQSPNLNRGQWRKLENYVRNKARGQTIYVMTGAVYDNTLHGTLTVPVPSSMYKVAYFKSGTEYWQADNKDGAKAVRVSKVQLEKQAGHSIP
jgi:endonuclease G